MDEQPLYILEQKKSRAILTKIISLITLCSIFYLGVLLNLALLQVHPNTEQIIRFTALGTLFLLSIIGTYGSINQAKKTYNFYSSYLSFGKKQILYNTIQPEKNQNILDTVFHTYKIKLNNNLTINHIPQETQLLDYINQLKNYSTTSTQ